MVIIVSKIFCIAYPILIYDKCGARLGGHKNSPLPYRGFCATSKLPHAKANRERVGQGGAVSVVTRLTNYPPWVRSGIVAGWCDLTLNNATSWVRASNILNKIALLWSAYIVFKNFHDLFLRLFKQGGGCPPHWCYSLSSSHAPQILLSPNGLPIVLSQAGQDGMATLSHLLLIRMV